MNKQNIKYTVRLNFCKGKRVIRKFKSINQLRAFCKYVRTLNNAEDIDTYNMYLEFCTVIDTANNSEKNLLQFLN